MEITKDNIFIYRTPLLKLSNLVNNENELMAAFKNPLIKEAILIASEDLYTQLSKLEHYSLTDPKKERKDTH